MFELGYIINSDIQDIIETIMSKKHKNSSNAGGFIVIIVLILATLGFFFLSRQGSNSNVAGESVVQQDNTQIIEIGVKGGYTPSNINAKAGVKTILKFKTNNTYDCSSSIYIPKLGLREFLPPIGEKVYTIEVEQASGKLNGSCSMGHYTFTINFV